MPRIRSPASNPSLTVAESRRQPFCVKLGEWIYFHFPACVKKSSPILHRLASRSAGRRLTSTSRFLSRGLLDRFRAPDFPPQWALLLLPLTNPVKKKTGEPCCSFSAFFRPGGAASTPACRAPSRAEPDELAASSDPSLAGVGRSTGLTLVCQAQMASQAPRGTVQASQGVTSRRPRLSPSTTPAVGPSRWPDRRARSWATIASSCRSVESRSSFTRT
jgi:hypothetical protein